MTNNGRPVRFDWLAAWFHGVSAMFHAFVLLIGPFDRYAWAYWKQLDAAFCWWRWLECERSCTRTGRVLAPADRLACVCTDTISAPIMFFCLQLLAGIRDQNTVRLHSNTRARPG